MSRSRLRVNTDGSKSDTFIRQRPPSSGDGWLIFVNSQTQAGSRAVFTVIMPFVSGSLLPLAHSNLSDRINIPRTDSGPVDTVEQYRLEPS